MATIYTMTKPEEGWSLVSHFIGNLLTVLHLCSDKESRYIKEMGEEKCSKIIYENRTELVGSLYMIVRKLKIHGYQEDAQKVQDILDLVTDPDVTDKEMLEAVEAKHTENNAQYREFRAALAHMKNAH